MAHLTCPACGLSLQARFSSIPVQYCPRCLARRTVVELIPGGAVAPASAAGDDTGGTGPRRPPAKQPCCLRIGMRTVGDIALLELAGELDVAAGEALRQAVTGAECGVAGLVVIDLGGLEFIDACGLRALIDAERRLGGRLRLLPAHGAVARVLEITGLIELLPFAFNGPLVPSDSASVRPRQMPRPDPGAASTEPAGTEVSRPGAPSTRRPNTNRSWEWQAIRRRVR